MALMTTGTETKADDHRHHDWREAGDAWGHAANDWAYLYEHYADDVMLALFDRLGVGPALELLDVACGAGHGRRAQRRPASTPPRPSSRSPGIAAPTPISGWGRCSSCRGRTSDSTR